MPKRHDEKSTQGYLPTLPAHALDHPPEGVGEDVWIDVIRKMDEVYSDLLQYEVALEEKNAKLEETQKFIFSVLTSMSDVLVVCDRHGVIQEVNQALADLVGQSEDELRGTPLIDLFSDDASSEQARRFLRDLHSERIHDCELHFKCRYAPEMPVAVNCTPRLSPVGKFVGMVMTGRPVGDLRRAYEQLRQAHEDLKLAQQQLIHSEKMASLGRLVAGVAHELNNPISFVLGNVHALQRYASRLAGYLEIIHRGAGAGEIEAARRSLRIDRILDDLPSLIEGTIEGAERTRAIVDGLKRFSAMDRDEVEDFDLVEVVERAVRWVCKTAREDFRVELALPPRIALRGSPGRIQQVVTNLIENARDATTAGDGPPTLRISATVDAADVRMCFDDNGPGIPAEILGRIFDPFFTTKPVGKGTGLGLSISYGIVERHGGTLTAENRPEGGARLVLTLPVA